MKYVDEYRDNRLGRGLAAALAAQARPDRQYRLMEFCGGHTHAISRFGLTDLLPANVHLIHGPGCPVCVLPIGRIDQAIGLALEHRVILCTYGDCLRVPASKGLTLLKARAQGADIRVVYSTQDALQLAQQNPQRQVVFLAIGFETTTPATAVALAQARRQGINNFSVLCNHVLTPSAMHAILAADVTIDGFVGPAHVSTVIGAQPYQVFASHYRKPVVIAGFEPLDILNAIRLLIVQINEGKAVVENDFTRAVHQNGNTVAQDLIAQVFEVRQSFEWRGLGTLPDSALGLRPAYASLDAEQRFALDYQAVADNKACECGAILRGQKHPRDCAIFGTVCTPDNPIGSCMVSSEGACAAHFTYGRFRT